MGMVNKENQQNLDKTKPDSNTVLHNIPCFYTNADQFKRKFSDFSIQVWNEQQMLIAITEAKIQHG